MGKFRFLASAAAIAIVGALVPFAAHAEGDCTSSIVIFSRPVSLNSNALRCIADPAQDAGDGRIINPGSDSISVRYVKDLGAARPTITATLNGLGFVNQSIVLTRSASTVGATYDSPVIALPGGRASSGCVTAHIGGDIDEGNSFHTVDSSC